MLATALCLGALLSAADAPRPFPPEYAARRVQAEQARTPLEKAAITTQGAQKAVDIARSEEKGIADAARAADRLQNYLDEFVFRFNRRKTPMAAFQSLLGLASSIQPCPETQIRLPEPAG